MTLVEAGQLQANWSCSQLGGREHYAIPRALSRLGRLGVFCTDSWASPAIHKLARFLRFECLTKCAGRRHAELKEATVVSWKWPALLCEVARRWGSPACDRYLDHVNFGRAFAMWVREVLRRRSPSQSWNCFFGYDTASLETIEWCRERAIPAIVDQMDPNRVEFDLVREEEGLWPGWAEQLLQVPEEYTQRREQEWRLADRVVVNSEFSRCALLQQGVPSEKLVVIPLSYEIDAARDFSHRAPAGIPKRELHVLFLGQVILRKGIQYLIEAARLLAGEPIRFVVVGPLGITDRAVKSAPANVAFQGLVPRDQAPDWYSKSDVFVLPTISDGFAITQIEAMAHGLPVVTTPCCGDVVTDGIDGFIVPPRDPQALASALQRYVADRHLLRSHQEAALVKSRQFGLDRLAANLLALESDLLTGRR